MTPKQLKAVAATVAALGIAAIMMPSGARSQSQDSTTSAQAQALQAGVATDARLTNASATVPIPSAEVPKKTIGQQVKALVAKITPDRLKRDVEFHTASAKFPEFCQHWEQNLRDRQQNNMKKLSWTTKDGYETSTFTGYGKIAGCEAHQSKDGYSIGKITYEEFVYYLTGKTADEARKAEPKQISDTHTTEIFRWENNKWFY